jgi:hypothetical protein
LSLLPFLSTNSVERKCSGSENSTRRGLEPTNRNLDCISRVEVEMIELCWSCLNFSLDWHTLLKLKDIHNKKRLSNMSSFPDKKATYRQKGSRQTCQDVKLVFFFLWLMSSFTFTFLTSSHWISKSFEMLPKVIDTWQLQTWHLFLSD